jgi:hypothetical protein
MVQPYPIESPKRSLPARSDNYTRQIPHCALAQIGQLEGQTRQSQGNYIERGHACLLSSDLAPTCSLQSRYPDIFFHLSVSPESIE